MLWYYDLKKANYQISPNLEFVKLVDNFDAKYDVIFIFEINKKKYLSNFFLYVSTLQMMEQYLYSKQI